MPSPQPKGRRRAVARAALLAGAAALWAAPASAQEALWSSKSDAPAPIHSQYGGIGLLKTRTARMAPDSTLAASVSLNEDLQRYAITFQAAPWLEATFSYAGFDLIRANGASDTFDRQFDLKVKLWDEGLYLPQVAVGLQDFLGTGIFSGEYVVASKRVGAFDLSAGVGWGALASRGATRNPFTELSDRFRGRRDALEGQGGEVNFGDFFQGDDIGFFGGVSWDTPIRGLQLIAEYESDRSERVDGLDGGPLNFGLVYNVTPGIQLTGSALGGETFNAQVTFSSPVGEAARDEPPGDPPPMFHVREAVAAPDGGDDGLAAPIAPPLIDPIALDDPALVETLRAQLDREGIDLLTLEAGPQAIRIRIDNRRYRSEAKAVGRAARIMSRYAPASVEFLQVVSTSRSLDAAEFRLRRSVLERTAREIGYSIAPPALGFAYIPPGSAPVANPVTYVDLRSYPQLDWRIGPDLRYSAFDPDDPLLLELQAEAEATVTFAPGLSVTGSLGREIIGNISGNQRGSNSRLPPVRTNQARYNEETDVGLFRLTADYLFQPGPNLYASVSAGYLERMFGGAGGSVLWRPPNSRLAFGANAWYARQRGFETLLDFQDYDVVTGHASVYWDTPYAHWNVALHAGRYLAGDWGGTLELSRRFPNGWEVGAFATLTDVPFDEFGEGSFDKGIYLRIPFDWGLDRDTQSTGGFTIRPVQRDGGQRLALPVDLFGVTRRASRGEVGAQWDSFAH